MIFPALNLPLPQGSVPMVAIGVLLVGHTLIARYKTRALWDRTNETPAR